MKVVTSGLSFLDIDAYACSIAYVELLRLQGEEAVAYSSAAMNERITPTIRSWDVAFSRDYVIADTDTFILVDVSEPDYLERAVIIDRVEKVIDHHVGFEELWHDRIGDKANIEFIGAACTQIYEKWQAAGKLHDMSETSARLLVSGILDNTLNFQAAVTTARDRRAYEELSTIANLPHDWPAHYFAECQTSIFRDITHALANDTKLMTFTHLPIGTIAIGQLVAWDGNRAVSEYRSMIEHTMHSASEEWFVNLVSIAEGRSYFLCSSDMIAQWAEKILGAQFTERLSQANRLWLRKEIFKQDRSYAPS